MGIISLKYALLVTLSVVIFNILRPRYRVPFLILVSLVFISSFSYLLLPYILVYALFNYALGLRIPGSSHKIALYRTGVVINLTQLIVLKYSSFTLDPLFGLLGASTHLSKLAEIIIPVGISYFTLQGIGYLINVKMGWEKPEKNLPNFLLYILFFPKFLSGPIERSNHFLPQLKLEGRVSEESITAGLKLILTGVFKKVAIANQLAPYAIHPLTNSIYTDGLTSWVIFILQPLYLYFDFSGYTDIAVGVAKMFGINLLPNFNKPFFSENMTTFWKRFHISLSSWFNDYIFRQTSFRYRRWGNMASLYALFITWMLFGIWHGAGWTFMVIGVLQTLAISYEYFTKRIRLRIFSRVPVFINRWFSRLITYLYYSLCMVLFFSPDVKTAITFLSKLTRYSGANPFDDISIKPFGVLIFIPLILLIELLENDYNSTYAKLEKFWLGDTPGKRLMRWTVYSLVITIIYITGLKSQQFVYANF